MTWFPCGDPPLVCGHRGSSATHPENTVAAAAGAVEAGATWIEFDVRPSADGLVVHHDPATSAGIHIATSSSDELPSEVPDFAAFVAACGPLGLDVEMKTDDIDMPVGQFVERVAEALDQLGSGVPILVTSFDHDALAQFRALRSETATGMLFHDRPGRWVLRSAVAAGHSAIVPWFRLADRRLVAAAHEAGLGVATWTVNHDRHIGSMMRAGVDMIIGDDPGHIRELVEAT